MNRKSVGVLFCVGLLASLVAFPAVATEYYNWDAWATFAPWSYNNSPTNCTSTPADCGDNGTGGCWIADVATTSGILHWDLLCAPTDVTQWYRMQFSTSNPKPTFGAYPYVKMKLTVSGVPEGDLIKTYIPIEPGTGGGKYRRAMWIGNGTYILSQYMGDGTIVYDADGDTGNPNPVSTWQMKRFRPGFLVTWITDWATAWQDLSIDIDWIVVTDNLYYPDASAGAGGDIAANTIFAIEGRPLVLSAPSGAPYQWMKGINCVYDDERVHATDADLPPTRIAGSLLQDLVIASVATGDAGTYNCLYYEGGVIKSTSFFDLVVYPAPVVGVPIVSNPAADLIAAGYPLALTVPSGSAYQWAKDGEVLTGSTSDSLEFASLSAPDAGTYTCVYDDGGTLKETPGFVLDVGVPGSGGAITASGQPAWFGDTIVAGYPLTLTAPDGVDFIWYKDGAPVEDSANVTGSNTQTLQFSEVSAGDIGTYTCVFDDGSHKALMVATFELLLLGTVPVAGIAGLAACALGLAALAARRIRRR